MIRIFHWSQAPSKDLRDAAAVHALSLISIFWSVAREKHEGNDRRRFPWKDVLELEARLSDLYSECMVSSTTVQYIGST